MKTAIVIFASILSINSFSQTLSPPSKTPISKYSPSEDVPEFMGIPVDGTKSEVIAQFKAKGFSVTSNNPKDNAIQFKGVAGGVSMEVFAAFTPVSGRCWSFMVFLPKEDNWYDIKEQYKKYVDIFKGKYGEPRASYDFFSTPYYEGDGYEMSALQLGKCTYSTFWEKYSVQISKYKQVKLQYENPANGDLLDKEKEKVNKNIF